MEFEFLKRVRALSRCYNFLFSSLQFKSKMQIQIIRAKSGEPVMYRNVFHAAYVIVKKHGIRGAYQGLPATWLRNIPANSAFFGKFHRLDIFTPHNLRMFWVKFSFSAKFLKLVQYLFSFVIYTLHSNLEQWQRKLKH